METTAARDSTAAPTGRLGLGARVRQIDFDALKQFVAGVESELDLICARDTHVADHEASLVTTIREHLAKIDRDRSLEINWSLAYRAEKLMLALLPDERVDIELARRLDQLGTTDVPFAAFYTKAMADLEHDGTLPDATRSASEGRRELLVSLVGDIQTANCKRYIRMRYARSAIYKVGTVFVTAFLIFVIVLTCLHSVPRTAEPTIEADAPSGLSDEDA